MPRPSPFHPIPFLHVTATRDSIGPDGGTNTVGTGAGSVTSRSFMPISGKRMNWLFDRVAAWDIAISLKVFCPVTTTHEFQTVDIAFAWDRTATGTGSEDLTQTFMDPTAGATPTSTGRDLVFVDGPALGLPGVTNILHSEDDSGPLGSDGRADVTVFMQAFAYVGSWNLPDFAGFIMLDVVVNGAAWTTVDPFTGTIPPFVATSNQGPDYIHNFLAVGDTPTDFKIRGNFYGGISDHLGAYQFIATPSAWYPYKDADLVPLYNETTGELV